MLEQFRYDNLVVLPYWPLSLGSTVAVRRALEALRLRATGDIVCLPYPEVLRDDFIRALGELPERAKAMISFDVCDQRALVPVFVNEPPVEAARYATENEVPWCMVGGHFRMDNEVEERYTLPVEESLIPLVGMPGWMRMVGEHLRELRYDVRDRYDLGRIRELLAEQERVIMLVHVRDHATLDPILRDLGHADIVPFADRGVPVPLRSDHSKWKDGTALAHFMAPYPGLCKLYERMRARGDAASFDPAMAISTLAAELAGEAMDMHFSTEAHLRFQLLLDRWMREQRVVTPPIEIIVELATACFNGPFAVRLHDRLVTYLSELQDERVWTDEGLHPINDNVSWPGFKATMSVLLRKVHERSQRVYADQVTSVPFRGSLQGGLDVRRTLRSAFTGSDRIHVRETPPPVILHDALEPAIFLFPQHAAVERAMWVGTWCGRTNEGPQFTALWQFGTRGPDDRLEEKGFKFHLHRSFGMVAFCDPLLHLDRLRGLYDSEEEMIERIPGRRHDCFVLRDLERSTRTGAITWSHALFSAALHFARRAVLVMNMGDQPLPAWARGMAHRQGKRIIVVKNELLTAEEKRRLLFGDVSIEGRHAKPAADRNDVQYMLDMEERFGKVMSTVW